MPRELVRYCAACKPRAFSLQIEGVAGSKEKTIVRLAVPAEDRMQAFLWRHLVPAKDLRVLVYDPAYQPPLKRPRPKVTLK